MTNTPILLDLPKPVDHVLPDAHLLASAWAKYNRGVQHFVELSTAARQLMTATSENGRIEKVRVSSGRIDFVAKLGPVPLHVSSLTGDVVHNLRTGLDHAAWALSRANGFTGHRRDVSFPIVSAADQFQKMKKDLVRVFGLDATDLFERLQPFNGRTGLQWLADLDNVDKHEALLIVHHRLVVTSLDVRDSITGKPLAKYGDHSQPKPMDMVDGGLVFHLEHEGEGTPLLAITANFENSLALASDAARSWPKERLDLVLRQVMFDVEESLIEVQAHIDGPVSS